MIMIITFLFVESEEGNDESEATKSSSHDTS